jgi:two-component system chemotaxis sensor kinase CheA
MNALLAQFIAESREALESIAGKLMQLEKKPDDTECISELFRLVHTLKGSSGLFTFPEMTRVLHAGEDLLDMMRQGEIPFSKKMADELLDTMDFIATLCDEIEITEVIDACHAQNSVQLAERLHALMGGAGKSNMVKNCVSKTTLTKDSKSSDTQVQAISPENVARASFFSKISEGIKSEAVQRISAGDLLRLVVYTPSPDCFFQGDDPFFCARQTPELLYGAIFPKETWPSLAKLDVYRCNIVFIMIVTATENELAEHFRYVPDQVIITIIDLSDFSAMATKPVTVSGLEKQPPQFDLSNKAFTPKSESALASIVATQRRILALADKPLWLAGRLQAVAATLANCRHSTGKTDPSHEIGIALDAALSQKSGTPLITWINEVFGEDTPMVVAESSTTVAAAASVNDAPKFGRRAEDKLSSKVLRVDKTKIDTLMNLIGEIVVSKNSLPYLAHRAENQFGCRELSREIKAQHAVINRIAEEMQDAIMQVRMMPVSTVFQRFPRLVRDISRKLGKEVELVLEGEETEADKNIIESLADPLIHIVRNSLDHGFELPDVRAAAGKPAAGTIVMRASQEADHVLIEIADDGKGINPAFIKQKAFEKGLIDAATLDKISDNDAVNLVFIAGFSTAETVSDLSGRGVGMDVVRTAVMNVNGTIDLQSTYGKGTTIRISLPLSMAITKMMVVEADGQIFGVPMETVVETMRIPLSSITTIKHSLTTVLRGKVLPLKPLNTLLKLQAKPKPNADNEFAVLVVRINEEPVGLVVDKFRESLDVIQKPLGSVLSSLTIYSGSALMGDGTVLMVLNVKEIL